VTYNKRMDSNKITILVLTGLSIFSDVIIRKKAISFKICSKCAHYYLLIFFEGLIIITTKAGGT